MNRQETRQEVLRSATDRVNRTDTRYASAAHFRRLRVMKQSWPFDQPPNCGVITLRQIMERGVPILLVMHDEDDHGWQFLDGSENPDEADAVHVCLSHVVETDPSLFELADLPPGWQAWRPSPRDKWVRVLKLAVSHES